MHCWQFFFSHELQTLLLASSFRFFLWFFRFFSSIFKFFLHMCTQILGWLPCILSVVVAGPFDQILNLFFTQKSHKNHTKNHTQNLSKNYTRKSCTEITKKNKIVEFLPFFWRFFFPTLFRQWKYHFCYAFGASLLSVILKVTQVLARSRSKFKVNIKWLPVFEECI